MRRLEKLCFFCLVFFFVLPASAAATASTTLTLSPAEVNKQIQETFDLSVIIDTKGSSVVSSDLSFSFNPNILEVIDITAGDFLASPSTIQKSIDNQAGTIDYSFYTSAENAKSGQGTFAKVTFKAKNHGTSVISFDANVSSVYGLGEGNVLTSTSPSSITVSVPPAVSPAPPNNQPSKNSAGNGGGGGGGGGVGGGGGGDPAPSGSDLNGSGRVDIFDLSILLRNWGRSGKGDLNGSGKVDIFDLSILLRSWSR